MADGWWLMADGWWLMADGLDDPGAQVRDTHPPDNPAASRLTPPLHDHSQGNVNLRLAIIDDFEWLWWGGRQGRVRVPDAGVGGMAKFMIAVLALRAALSAVLGAKTAIMNRQRAGDPTSERNRELLTATATGIANPTHTAILS
jgi:hypothetical protein